MIIYTLQDKRVLDDFKVHNEPFRDDIKELYEKFFKFIGLNCLTAFWGWVRVYEIELDTLTDEEVMERLRNGPEGERVENGNVLIKLEIPNDEVVLTNYYEWVQIIFYTLEDADEAAAQISWKLLLDIDPSKANTVQANFIRIEREWIKAVIPCI